MNQQKINQYFQSELGQQCLSLYSTPDDRVFIRHNEAVSYCNEKDFDIDEIIEWFEEFNEIDPKEATQCPMVKVLKFIYNYDRDWVEQIFGNDGNLGRHFGDRFMGDWKELTTSNGGQGASYAVLKTLLTMSTDNMEKVWEYINKKY